VTDTFEAFLSYTRMDNEFFGGAVTSLRQLLELGVKVVTGDRSFQIFQDVDGIELGQRWKDRLGEAISASTFFIPIITPLFFTSEPCRDELRRFVTHEEALGRNDLILPVYFVTAPVLERAELRDADPLASLIASRQRFDWRVRAGAAPNDPQMRQDVMQLASGVADAMARTSTTVGAVDTPTRSDDSEHVRTLIEDLGQARQRKTEDRKLVLWVDDRPDNNVIERRSMVAYDIDFVLAESTDEALEKRTSQQFAAIISDMGRPPDAHAGYTLLEAVRRTGDQTPFFIYAGSRDPAHIREALSRGAQGSTNRGDELLQMVLAAIH
jgi:CheY-like chemotaxis protein